MRAALLASALLAAPACVPAGDENACLETIHLIEFDELRAEDISAAMALERLALPMTVPAGIYTDAPVDALQAEEMTQVFLEALYEGGEVRLHDRRENPDARHLLYPSACHDYITADVSLTLNADNSWFGSATVDASVRIGKVWRPVTPSPDETHEVYLRAELELDELPGTLANAAAELDADLLFFNWRSAEHIDGELVPARGELSARTFNGLGVQDEALVWFGEPDLYRLP